MRSASWRSRMLQKQPAGLSDLILRRCRLTLSVSQSVYPVYPPLSCRSLLYCRSKQFLNESYISLPFITVCIPYFYLKNCSITFLSTPGIISNAFFLWSLSVILCASLPYGPIFITGALSCCIASNGIEYVSPHSGALFLYVCQPKSAGL